MQSQNKGKCHNDKKILQQKVDWKNIWIKVLTAGQPGAVTTLIEEIHHSPSALFC